MRMASVPFLGAVHKLRHHILKGYGPYTTVANEFGSNMLRRFGGL